MKTVVVYRSKTGTAKKYADWIAYELSADILDEISARKSMLSKYDAVIFGGCVHMGRILGAGLIKRNLGMLAGKRVAVFAVGAAEATEETVNRVRDANFSREQQKQFRFFYLRGGFDLSKTRGLDRAMLGMMQKMLQRKKKENLTPDEADMLAAFSVPEEHVRRENVAQIVSCFKPTQ